MLRNGGKGEEVRAAKIHAGDGILSNSIQRLCESGRGRFYRLAGRLGVVFVRVAMVNIRRRKSVAASPGTDRFRRNVPSPPPEAFEYDDDVTHAAVQQLRDEAARSLDVGEWSVIEGYVGDKERSRLA